MYCPHKERVVAKNVVKTVELVTNYRAEAVQQAIDDVISAGAVSVLILCVDTSQDLSHFNRFLQHYSLPIIGGLFPGLIWQDQTLEQGCLVIGFNVEVRYQINHKISNKQNCRPSIPPQKGETLLVFIDGLSDQIETCIQHLYDWVGNDHSVIGAGAGSLSLQQKPCILCNDGVFEDAMLVASLPAQIDISIAHGWQQVAGPFLATSVDGNLVKEINYQPAFDVYKSNIAEHLHIDITEKDFFEHASSFPLGVHRLDDDMLIRDPIKLTEKGILCVGAIPENSMLYILTGQNQHLIQSVSDALQSARKDHDCALVIDCVSRMLFLQRDFNLEIDTIRNGVSPFNQFIAILGLGEIASGKYGAINFHNKTSVIGSLSLCKDVLDCNT